MNPQDKPLLLIVDDDEMNLSILEEVLSDQFFLQTASDGQQAIDLVEKIGPALVLMDIMMPKVNGYEACRAIKAMPKAALTPVILVSAKASSQERVEGYTNGADDYLIKPFDEHELLAKVGVHLRLRSALIELQEAKALLADENQALSVQVVDQEKQLKDSRDLVMFALASLADSRDPETGEHLERMREYCRILAQWLACNGQYQDQIDQAFVDSIYQASPLHDIGKVGIPDMILLKPGRLTDSEFEIMKEHAVIGADALKEVLSHGESAGFLAMAHEIARSHHERWDGSGYPDGLSGEQIPLSARICEVADVFDALTSVRVYKRAFTIDVARSMIMDERGKHFDPGMIDAFEACFDEMVVTRERFSQQNRLAA